MLIRDKDSVFLEQHDSFYFSEITVWCTKENRHPIIGKNEMIGKFHNIREFSDQFKIHRTD